MKPTIWRASRARLYSPGPMLRRHLNGWIAWLLPLLVLRAFIPAGLMLSPEGGHLTLTWCAGLIAPATTSQAQALQGQHEHHHDGQPATNSDAGSAPCPFALVASACTVEAPVAAILFVRTSLETPAFESVFLSRSLLTADRIRGPPSLV